jgi:predicted acylesterase/phospholipase RssA
MLHNIAVEYAKGRRLIIGTTNLDAKRPALWDITAIAASGRKEALRLVQDVILASASIPGVFPPVYIKVEADEREYDEMHVDGGMTFQVFLYPPQLEHKRLSKIVKRDLNAHIYVIRNARLDPKWDAVKPKLGPIAAESISTLILNQGMGNLELIYFLAMRDGYDFNLAYIPSEFKEEPNEQFDIDYMKKLFDVGYNLARTGYPWQKIPPRLKKPE